MKTFRGFRGCLDLSRGSRVRRGCAVGNANIGWMRTLTSPSFMILEEEGDDKPSTLLLRLNSSNSLLCRKFSSLTIVAKVRAFSSIADPVSCMPTVSARRAQVSSARPILGNLRSACLDKGWPPLLY